MSSLSTIHFDLESPPTSFRSVSLNVKKNRYASPDMKVLISKYKKKKIRKKIKELIPDIQSNFKTINISNKKIIEDNKKEFPNINTFSSPNLLDVSPKTRNNAKTINLKLNNNFFRSGFKTKNYSIKPPYRNFIKEYLNELTTKKGQADSIYKALSFKKFRYLNNLNEYIHRTEGPKRKIMLGLSPFPMKNKNLELKISDPNNNIITLYNKCFHSPAIGERYERHMKELLRLKSVMKNIKEKYPGKKDKYSFRMLSNYLSQNGIFDKKYYTENYLSNFRDFLEIDFDVNPQISYKIFLHEILNGDYDKYVLNPMDSNNSSLIYYETHHPETERLDNDYMHHKTNSEKLKKN